MTVRYKRAQKTHGTNDRVCRGKVRQHQGRAIDRALRGMLNCTDDTIPAKSVYTCAGGGWICERCAGGRGYDTPEDMSVKNLLTDATYLARSE